MVALTTEGLQAAILKAKDPYCAWAHYKQLYEIRQKSEQGNGSQSFHLAGAKFSGPIPAPPPAPAGFPPKHCGHDPFGEKFLGPLILGAGAIGILAPAFTGGAAAGAPAGGSGVVSVAPVSAGVVAPVTLPSIGQIGAALSGALKTAMGAAGLVKSLTGGAKSPQSSDYVPPGTVADGTQLPSLSGRTIPTWVLVGGAGLAVAGLIYFSRRSA